ncbi:MAG: hypothetical protein ACR2H4_15425 [Pyrinomonadaceae bacterium]
MLNPQNTYIALLVVQAFHLLHHRLAKRHISFAEVVSALVLCVPPWAPIPLLVFMGAHLSLIAVQVVGSVWIEKLSPAWGQES